MQKHIGYTSELFRIDGDSIYKYTNDSARISFMKEQMNHLLLIGLKDPLAVPKNIEWHEEPGKWGYVMEYIKDAERIEDKHLPDVYELIRMCSQLGLTTSIPSFTTFIDYLKVVINNNHELYHPQDLPALQKYYDELKENVNEFDTHKSSSHGDFTMENILVSDNRLILIDTIYKEGMWSSWLQDVAKFYQNIYFSDVKKTLEFSQLVEQNENHTIFKLIHYLMIANYIRMFPYIKKKPEIFTQRYSEFQILLNSI